MNKASELRRKVHKTNNELHWVFDAAELSSGRLQLVNLLGTGHKQKGGQGGR